MKSTKASSQNRTLISVIMPVYNAEKFVAEAIQSILDQTHKNLELVIVDDASKDSSWKIINRFQKRYPKIITAIRIAKNLNQGGDKAGNVAFAHTNPKSQFIARMDADDVAQPHRLKTQLAFLRQHPEIDVVGSWVETIDLEGETLGQKKVAISHQAIYKKFFELHPMIHPTVMLRRSAVADSNELYQIRLSSNNDYVTFARLISSGKKFANIPEILLRYRLHSSNDSLSHIKRTFFNSLKTRLLMVFEYGYKPSIESLLICAFQVVVLSFIPERLVLKLYLWNRGMVKTDTNSEKEAQTLALSQ